jgi:hypothetical protein
VVSQFTARRSPAARAEPEIVYATLFRRIPGLRPTLTLDELAVKDDGFVYGLYELPVTW